MLARLRRARNIPSLSEAVVREPPADDHVLATLHDQAEPIIKQVELDLHTLIGAVQRASAEVSRSIAQAGTSLTDIGTRTATLVTETQAVDGTAALLAQAAKDLTQASANISVQIHNAAGLLDEVSGVMKAAQTQIEHLRSSSGEIGAVVNVVAGIAKQTNLLALNAMIEASRSGEHGRGFAVVAQEVKDLAGRTAKATDQIRISITRLQQDAAQSAQTVIEAVGLIAKVGPKFVEVVAAVEEQNASTAELTRSAEAVAGFVSQVVGSAGAIREQAHAASSMSLATATSSSTVDRLHGRTLVVLRTNPLGNRRQQPRLPVALDATLRQAGYKHATRTVDVSEAGFLVSCPAEMRASVGSEWEVETAELGRASARVVGVSNLGLHMRIIRAPEGYRAAVERLTGSVNAQNAGRIARVQSAAQEIGAIFETAVARGTLSEATLFDTTYEPVLGTNPQQYLTPALSVLEGLLTPIQERLLQANPQLSFCVAMDRNAYLPVHNLKYAQPQRPGELVWNTANSRNRRIFDDRAGLMAARNTDPFLVQSYARDMGGQRMVLMQEVDAPILIHGRHWGGFRMAFSVG